MSTPCCSEGNCCVFLRGTIYIRAAGGVYRALGNVSQFRLTHENSEYLPLNGELDPSCCEFEAVQAQIVLRCFDNANTLLGFGGEATSIAAGSVTETLTWTSLDVGSLLPFSHLVDQDTIVVGASTIGFTPTSYGLIAKDCALSAGQVTVTYTRLKARTVNAGEACSQTYELMYVGTNSFDGSEVILTIPKIRLRSVSSFDWINQTDAGEMALEGTLLPQATSPVWYNFTRRDCTELCPCSTPVVTAPTLPLVFQPNVAIGTVVFSATPATSAALVGNLPTGITATTTTSGSTVTVTLTGTPTVALQAWDASYTFTSTCDGGEPTTASVDLGDGCVILTPAVGKQTHPICTNTPYPTPAHPSNGGPNNRQPWVRVTNATSVTYTGTLPTGVTALQIVQNGANYDLDFVGTPTTVGQTVSLVVTAVNSSGACSQTVTRTITFTVAEGCAVQPTIGDMTPDTVFTVGTAASKTISIQNASSVLYQSDDPTPIVPTGVSWDITTSGTNTTVTITGTPTVPDQSWKMRVAAYLACGDCTAIVVREFSGSVINDFPWFLRTSTFVHRAVAYGNGVWVASQAMGTTPTNAAINTSTDGVTWTAPASSTTSEITNEVEFANGLFVHVGELGRVTTSTDGVTWTQRAQLPGTSPRLRAVHYDNGLWVAVGGISTQNILTSTDGITWTPRTASTTEIFQDVFFANGRWTAVGTFRNIWTSIDGVNWVSETNPGTVSMSYTAVRYGNGLWVTVGSSGAILTSTGGAWTLRTSGTTQQFNDVRYANGRWVAVGNNGIIRTSTDGITWVDGSVGATPLVNWTTVEYADGRWVIGAASAGLIYSSSTAAAGSWTNRTPTGSTGSVNDLLYANGKWVAVGNTISTT